MLTSLRDVTGISVARHGAGQGREPAVARTKENTLTTNKIRRLLAATIAGTTATLALAACGSDGSAPEDSKGSDVDGKTVEKKTIGWIDATMAGEYQQRIFSAGQAAADELGWELKTVDTAGDPNKAAAGALNLVNQNVDAIVISAVTPSTMRAGLTKAKQKGIPIILVSAEVDDSLNEELGAVYYGKREAELAKPLAGAIIEDLEAGDKVGVLTSTLLLSGPLRSDNIEDPLKEAGIEIVGSLDTGFDFKDAQANANALISQNPDLTAIVPVFDLWTAATVAAVKASGKDILVYPFEADPVNVDLMRKNPEMIKSLTDGNMIDSPFIAFDQLLKFFVDGKKLDPNAAEGKFTMKAIRFDELPPGKQNGPLSLKDASAPFFEKWNAEYDIP